MKTSIQYYIANTSVKSDCGDVLDISLSSRDLKWDGVLLERGTSPYFHPKDIETPNFYFAIEMSNEYTININNGDKTISKSIEPEDIWVNPPYTPFTHNIDEPCDFIIVTVTKEKMFNSFTGTVSKEISFLNNYNLKDDVLSKLLQLLYIEVSQNLNSGNWYVDNIMNVFANHFIRNYSNYYDIKNKKAVGIFGERELEFINEYINKNITELITVEDLAKRINTSKFYFLREFKAYMDITPYQYIISRKIKYSEKLLKNTNDSITTIALKLGFNDSSHFTRTFKQHQGITPKQYRK